jgi:DNA-directed RNA polymerase specialized sigma24 family protein
MQKRTPSAASGSPSVSSSQAQPRPGHADDEVEATVARIIAAKARRLIGRHGFKHGDYKDLVQELTLEWLRYRPSFDAARAQLSTYATRVVENRIAWLIRHRRAAKRGADRPVTSLSRLVKDPVDGWVQEGSLVSEDNLPGGAGSAGREVQRDLRLDVAAVLASLPEHLRDLCEHLQTMTIAEYVRHAGIPRSTVYEAIGELRRRFAAAGFAEFLPTFSDPFAQND